MADLPDCAQPCACDRPRALRFALALAALVATALLADSALATTRSETSLRTLNHQVLAAVNEFRASHGLAPLRESAALDRSARQHSLEMGRDGYFAHSSADGTAFWRRIRHYYAARNYSYWSVGENLLWRVPSLSAAEAMKLWIASPEHLRNLLTPAGARSASQPFTSRVLRASSQGRTVTVITTDFGVRR